MKLEREAVSDSVKEETDLLWNDDDGGNGSSGEQREVGSGGGGDGHRGGGAPVLKKGPWTAAEDKILIDYVNKNGEGNWNQVQKNSGLFRCGKSCRLRWANHLRPNLKKGQFSEEEENLIIRLHAKMGNKWAQMATHLPGRTDNEIKNFWNTRTKRCQRSGKPIYPDELRVPNEDLHCQSPSEFCGKKRPNEFSQGNGFDLPQVIFENFNYELPLSDISVCNLLGRTILASNYLSINHPPKRLAVTDSLIAGFGCSVSGNPFPNQSEKIPTFATDFDHQIYDFDPGRTKNVAVPFSSFIASGHPNLNGNFSTSGPMMNSVKMELPSFQYDNNDPCSNWYDGPAGSPIEQIDTCLQSPASSASVLPGCISQQNNRLFDELVHKGQELGGTTKSQGSMEASVPTPAHDPMLQNVEFSVSEEQLGGNNEFGCNIDHSSASVLCECPIGSSSVEEFQPPKSPSSWNDPLASTEHFTDTKIKANSLSSQPDFLRPDALPGSSLLNESSRELKDQYIDDTLAALFHGDPYDDYKPLSAGDLAGSGFQLGLESFPWRNMPRACHMSEFPQNHDGNC